MVNRDRPIPSKKTTIHNQRIDIWIQISHIEEKKNKTARQVPFLRDNHDYALQRDDSLRSLDSETQGQF